MWPKVLLVSGVGMFVAAAYLTWGGGPVSSPAAHSVEPAVSVQQTEWSFPDFPVGEEREITLTIANAAPVALEVAGLVPT